MRAGSPAELLSRRLLPRTVVALSRVDWPARSASAARRRLGRRGRLELFFAFDDPCSAVALVDFDRRLAHHRAMIVLKPVVHRGIPGDPAVERKRRYALEDAGRFARRLGFVLSRSQPLQPQSCAFLAEWVAQAPQGPALQRFCVAALRQLWLAEGEPSSPAEGDAGSDGVPDRAALELLWTEQLGSPPPSGGSGAVARNERLMTRRGPYETPAACVHGRWYFAHDRLAQIAGRLEQLGWGPA